MDDIITTARKLIEEGTVSAVIGYAEGSIPGRTRTFITNKAEEADGFIFNRYCVNNLTVYLTKSYKLVKDKPVGIFVKGCDARTVNSLIQEHQIKKEDVILIGLKCDGVCYGIDNETALKCTSCMVKDPKFYDILAGTPSTNVTNNGLPEPAETGKMSPAYEKLQEIENMGIEERWHFWNEQFDKCIRCYACRQACPLCYCEQCISDKTQPAWIDSSTHPIGNLAWHLIRAFHLAGRCIGCNECERACHQNIPLSLLNMKMAKEVYNLYGYRAGEDPEAKMPLTDYRMDDNQDFIL